MKKAFVILAATLSMSGAFAQSAASSATATAASSADVRAAQHQQRVEERITWLHSQLKITPEQEPQWKAFADVMRTNGQTMAALYKQRMETENTRNALDDMKQYAQITQAHADDMQKLVTAFEPLYNSLSPEQKTLADQTFRRDHEHGQAGKPAHPKHKSRTKPSAAAAASDAASAAQ
ncbi:MAG TPA: Spy/CpxP family protein refolding chaperone [Paraburkholderia sp.]|uniref:Spy/CpxP family protein refolding chaperone n=1 Tax=Paraburkholderia sp. TaxID=1926495 RepID=UPI002C749235|nr:Spy/CpxP family protein refolding chaperone [Paraburkholderia sp.]HTR06576.1 Spy/CpxP family protein refolding chaperone [Paraburkholderia sp.]